MDNSKIAILSTVINKELYQISSPLFPEKIQKYIIDGTNGMHGISSIFYMMEKLKGKGIEWLIMSDEDVLFANPSLVFDLIEKMRSENYTICGIRDGGLIRHRVQNPFLINTFFSIINFKEVESLWDKKEVLKNNYILENEFDDNLEHLTGLYDLNSLKEPYYCFYLWLRRKNKKIFFLDTKMAFNDDDFTNVVYFENVVLLYHTWHARFYGKSKQQTERINKVLHSIVSEKKELPDLKVIVFKDKLYAIKNKSWKQFYKIKNRMHNFSVLK